MSVPAVGCEPFLGCVLKSVIRLLLRLLPAKTERLCDMKNSHKYFSNTECKYFPCHTIQSDEFNCLFCYCPLYLLGDKCGGNYIFGGEKRVKDCIDCHLPHMPEFYDSIVERILNVRQMFDSTGT